MRITSIASGSSGNAYVLEDPQAPLLLEAGLAWNKLSPAFHAIKPRPAMVLVTHEHMDHAASVKKILERGYKVGMSRGTAEALNAQREFGFVPLGPDKSAKIAGRWVVRAFPVEHDAADPLGFLLDHKDGARVAFMTDTAPIRIKLPDVSHLMVECNFSMAQLTESVLSGKSSPHQLRRLPSRHMSLEALLAMIQWQKWTRLQEIHLLHMSDFNTDEKEIVLAVQRATGALVKACPKRS